MGNLDAKRDWGYAKDYVECMWLMLQHPVPEDFVIATGQMHSVREFIELAFKEINVNIEWMGKGADEKGLNKKTGEVIIEVDPIYFRPAEVDQLCGNPAKAQKILGWNPTQTSFEDLIKIMMKHDFEFVKK